MPSDPADESDRRAFEAALEEGVTVNEFIAALVILAEAGIPTDVQELLVSGDPMRGIKPNALYDALGFSASEFTRLKRENEHFTSSGIIEVAVRNQSVSDYMNHWEGRALSAEQKVAELEEEVSRYQQLLDAAIDDYNGAIKPKPEATTAAKPFTFADPNAQQEWERQRAESRREK